MPNPKTIRVRIAVAVAAEDDWDCTRVYSDDAQAAREVARYVGARPRITFVEADVFVPTEDPEQTVEGKVTE